MMKHFSMFLSHLGIGHSKSSMEKASFEVALKSKKQITEETKILESMGYKRVKPRKGEPLETFFIFKRPLEETK